MDDSYHQEQYYFNGTPAQFGRDVKILILNGDERRHPRHYTAADYSRRRPYRVHLLNQGRDEIIGRVETRHDKERTLLIVSWPVDYAEGARASWSQLQADLASLDWQIEPVPGPPPTDVVFADYYRRRAMGDKVTLKDIAQEHGYSPEYLRRVKADYDRRTDRRSSGNARKDKM
ncbi:MAG: hypothetical protein HGA45_25740 [Chloroflexales bacterium]|nr:hypothetical protein [Chloroflexales bacterium]